MSATERLAEIESRYGGGHVVVRFAESARDELLATAARIEEQLHRTTVSV